MTLIHQYREFVLQNQRLPKHITDISKDLSEYESISDVEKEIWMDYATLTLNQCVEDDAFGEYIAREKMLGYVYALLQNISEDDALINMQLPNFLSWWNSPLLSKFKLEYLSFVKVLIEEGQERGEIQKRPFIYNIYPKLFWLVLLSILSFWAKDKSENKEQTDVAVEKFVNLLFDTIAPNAVDSAVDLFQFMFKQSYNGNTK
ncbi:MAG: TetR family transcriptional regulator C-terminal domain-containing protein [Chitinophagales bacterium]|nr:TetR family transcriptional regulator C-terminal domain-containing protein [Chitinophagales bacterium]